MSIVQTKESTMKRSFVLGSTAVILISMVSACSGTGGATAATIIASETNCDMDVSEFQAGRTAFEVSNKGSRVTEVYVYGPHDGTYSSIISEVENIGPGSTIDMAVNLKPGNYEIACKPGMTGDGIRHPIAVK
jgi:iron uptake system component EfeO